jgi:hypothetical protein
MAKTKKEEERDKALPIVVIFGAGVAGLAIWLLLGRRKIDPEKAILFGTVTDAETQAGIPNINVVCDGYTAKTDAGGDYTITNIPPGTYSVSFTDPFGRYQPVTV